MRRSVGSARIAQRVLSTVIVEAERTYPFETGGVLLGYWSIPYTEVAITDVVGPGPRAIHEPTRFVPDADYQEAEIADRYLSDPAHRTYLGDWHSHPRGQANLSSEDRRTLLSIATYQEARAPVPLMAVLTRDTEWQVSVWRFRPPIIELLGSRGRVSLLRLRPLHEDGTLVPDGTEK